MSPRIVSVPKYRRHKGTGQAIVQVNGRRHYLGKWDSPKSKEAYARFVAELAVSPAATKALPLATPSSEFTVVELVAAYVEYAQGYYRHNGKPTRSLDNIKLCSGWSCPDPTLPGPQEAERSAAPAAEALGGTLAATPRGLPRNGLRPGPEGSEDDGPLAGATEPGCRGQPAGRDGGNAHGGSSGRARAASPHLGHDQSDRVGLQRGGERDSPGEALA